MPAVCDNLHLHSYRLLKMWNDILNYARSFIENEFKLDALLQQDFGNFYSAIQA